MSAEAAGYGAELRNVSLRFGSLVALDDVTVAIRPGVITGLLGRNGSGKTSLAALLAAYRRPSSGQVLVDGEDPWENERVIPGACLVREAGDVLEEVSMRDNLAFIADARPTFDHTFAGELLDRFELDLRRRPGKLSRGKRSAFAIVLGLASRAPLTILDEVYLGLDAASRYAFYDALLTDYAAHPRTIVLSSHLIDEVDRLLEDVVLLEGGRLLVAQDVDALREQAVSVTGPDAAVQAFVTGRDVLATQRLGGSTQATLRGALGPDELAAARAAGLRLGAVPLQDLVVHLTARSDAVGGARNPEEIR